MWNAPGGNSLGEASFLAPFLPSFPLLPRGGRGRAGELHMGVDGDGQKLAEKGEEAKDRHVFFFLFPRATKKPRSSLGPRRS